MTSELCKFLGSKSSLGEKLAEKLRQYLNRIGDKTMKKVKQYTTILLLAAYCCSSVWAADDAALRAKIDAFYKEYNQAIESKNLDTLMNFFSSNFNIMGALGGGKEQIRTAMEGIFKQHQQLRNTLRVDSITPVDANIQVIGEANLESKKSGESQWSTIIKSGFIDIIKEENGSLKVTASGQVDLDRMKNIQGAAYTNKTIGYSFSAPQGWSMLPFTITHLQDGVMMLTPDNYSPGYFGHVQIPYNVGVKQAIESDDAVMKKLVKTFKVEKSAPITVKGLEGYESLTQYTADKGDEVTRHRIYLSGGGLLYVFIMEAPSKHWGEVKDALTQIVNSFELTAEAQKSGAARQREKTASGEIMDRIYSSKELGCQIAAPKGWAIEPTPLGNFQVSISMKPAQGDSLARLIAVDAKGMVEVKDVFDQEMNGIKAITENFTINEEAKDIELAGVTGRTAIFTFTLEGLGTVQRKSVMLVKNGVLYMILCDAIPPEKMGEMAASFDAIIKSFTLN